MPIASVRFSNFKALSSYSVPLQSMNVLVGPNNSGKSTILSAFRVLEDGPPSASEPCGKPPGVSNRRTLSAGRQGAHLPRKRTLRLRRSRQPYRLPSHQRQHNPSIFPGRRRCVRLLGHAREARRNAGCLPKGLPGRRTRDSCPRSGRAARNHRDRRDCTACRRDANGLPSLPQLLAEKSARFRALSRSRRGDLARHVDRPA